MLEQSFVGAHHKVEEARVDVHCFAIPMEFAFACSPRTFAPAHVDVFNRALHLIAPHEAQEDKVAEDGRRNHAHIGANLLLVMSEVAKRLERNELIDLMKIMTDGSSEAVMQ